LDWLNGNQYQNIFIIHYNFYLQIFLPPNSTHINSDFSLIIFHLFFKFFHLKIIYYLLHA
jgi:hypothetical protein